MAISPKPAIASTRIFRFGQCSQGIASEGWQYTALLAHALISADVAFNYGEPFALATSLRIDGFVDQGSGTFDTPYINEVAVVMNNTLMRAYRNALEMMGPPGLEPGTKGL